MIVAAMNEKLLIKEFSKLISSSFGLFMRTVLVYDKQQHPFAVSEVSANVMDYQISDYFSGATNSPSSSSFGASTANQNRLPAANTLSSKNLTSNGLPSSSEEASPIISSGNQPSMQQIRKDLEREKQQVILERAELQKERAKLEGEKKRAASEKANMSFLGSLLGTNS